MKRRKKPPYVIEYSPPSREHLAALSPRQRATVLDEVDVQLLRQRRVAEIRTVRIKHRDRVFIGGEEIDLS